MQRAVDPALYPGSTLAVHDMPLRQVVRSSAAARNVTVAISNDYGNMPLRIARAGIGHVGADAKRLSGSTALRFDGRPYVVVPQAKWCAAIQSCWVWRQGSGWLSVSTFPTMSGRRRRYT